MSATVSPIRPNQTGKEAKGAPKIYDQLQIDRRIEKERGKIVDAIFGQGTMRNFLTSTLGKEYISHCVGDKLDAVREYIDLKTEEARDAFHDASTLSVMLWAMSELIPAEQKDAMRNQVQGFCDQDFKELICKYEIEDAFDSIKHIRITPPNVEGEIIKDALVVMMQSLVAPGESARIYIDKIHYDETSDIFSDYGLCQLQEDHSYFTFTRDVKNNK